MPARVLADLDEIAKARRLAAYGARHRSADSLVAAARILIDVRPRDCCRETVEPDERFSTPDDRAPGPDEPPGIDAGSTAASFLATARTLVAPGSPLMGEIEALEPRAKPPLLRGASAGPWKQDGRVPPESRHLWEIAFDGGEAAVVRVIGDGETNLDLFVFDADGNLIAADDDLSDDGQVRWTPGRTGAFQVVIDNRGDASNAYWLITN